jgi:peptide chain release factor 1
MLAAAQEQADAAASDVRKSQVRSMDRSERIRTYNYPQNRISDHRIGYTAYNLDLAMGGDLDAVLNALAEADRAARLSGETELTRQ